MSVKQEPRLQQLRREKAKKRYLSRNVPVKRLVRAKRMRVETGHRLGTSSDGGAESRGCEKVHMVGGMSQQRES